ncbi:hypothetical protein FVE85_4529 [Porphyridium purpureum]|uniref:BZIP domain-containing protein n=1 Tax=Porphyridium purpureum TaxID=35688 RepID=A0A5J4YJ82_PORPP|nr:hypothetical protein FVE85_4529 [Porphyridium purpureum]|eukprot:POR3980..scf297_16
MSEEVFVADWDAMLFEAKNSAPTRLEAQPERSPCEFFAAPPKPTKGAWQPSAPKQRPELGLLLPPVTHSATVNPDVVQEELDQLKGLLGLDSQASDSFASEVKKEREMPSEVGSYITKSMGTSSSSISRTERNRLAARRCRQRKKELLSELAERYSSLQQENRRLRRMLMGVLAGSIDRSAVPAMMSEDLPEEEDEVVDAARRAATGLRYDLPYE